MGSCSVAVVVLVSLLGLITELSLNSLAAFHLFTTNQLLFFSLLVGVLLLVSVVIQLLSWQFQTTRDHKDRSRAGSIAIVILHILQVGLIWRYMRILASKKLTLTREELWETFMLRTVQCICSTLPVLLLMSYIVLSSTDWSILVSAWPVLASLVANLLSVSWGLATFRKHKDYCCITGAVVPGVGLLFKVVWRMGEVISRALTLVMFAQVQGYWLFLLVGGHWITMLVLVTVEATLQDNSKNGVNKGFHCKMIGGILMKSYVYIFCYLNPSGGKSKYGTAVYYIITCMESIALLALWIIYDNRTELHIPLSLTVTISCAIGLSFGALFYACFHRSGTSHSHSNIEAACLDECLDCHKKRCGVGFLTKPQRPAKPWEPQEPISPPLQAEALLGMDYNPVTREVHNENVSHAVPTVANVRALDGGYHNVLLNKHKGQRSLTPLVLMDTENQHRKPQHLNYDGHSTRRQPNHSRTASLDYLWDNYDLQIKDQLEHDNATDTEVFHRPKKLGTHHFHTRDNGTGTPTLDQGYYSAISSSSKENSRKAAMAAILERDPISHLQHLHVHPNSSMRIHSREGGALSDGNTSSYSTTSSKRAFVNCGKCGNSLSIENAGIAPSMFSLASSTSYASSAPSSYYPRRRASIHVMDRSYYRRRQRRRLMAQTKFGAEEPETLEQAMARIHGAGLPYRHSIRSSDITSSAWEYTDSEI